MSCSHRCIHVMLFLSLVTARCTRKNAQQCCIQHHNLAHKRHGRDSEGCSRSVNHAQNIDYAVCCHVSCQSCPSQSGESSLCDPEQCPGTIRNIPDLHLLVCIHMLSLIKSRTGKCSIPSWGAILPGITCAYQSVMIRVYYNCLRDCDKAALYHIVSMCSQPLQKRQRKHVWSGHRQCQASVSFVP